MHNLLEDRLLRARLADGAVGHFSLPTLYVALREDRVADFPALRPHQRHAWHAYLAQLAAIAVHRRGGTTIPESAGAWGTALRALTSDFPEDEPWRLVVEDAGKPAFMQCPAPDGFDAYRKRIMAPDDLDMLVTSKNHEVKQTMGVRGSAEDWLFALIDLQTMAGFLGAGNHGVARMNGGFSSRSCLGLAPADGGPGAHVFCDVRRMVADRDRLLERMRNYFRTQGGLSLLWLEPWGGVDSLDLRDLDPYFIEISRRIRVRCKDGALEARAAPSKKPRIAAKDAKGNVGDFWTAVDDKEGKALSVSAGGFHYRKLAELLFDPGRWSQPASMAVDRSDRREWVLVARAVTGGQGKTEGYHERTDIRFAPRVAGLLRGRAGREQLGEVAKGQIEEVTAVGNALRFAIATAASGGKPASEVGKSDRTHAVAYLDRLDRAADARFFAALERRFLAHDGARAAEQVDFVRQLIDVARTLLAEAVEAVPCPTIRRHRARARAHSAFERSLANPKGALAGVLSSWPPRDEATREADDETGRG